MTKQRSFIALASIAAFMWPCAAFAQLGEPQAFDITVKQGGTTIATKHVTVGPNGDLQDIKAAYQDGTPEDYTALDVVSPSGTPSPIILKLVSEPSTTSDVYQLLHFYLDVPLSLQQLDLPGNDSLFDLNGLIDVTISGMTLDNGAAFEPRVEDQDGFYTSFMRDRSGHFYESVQAHPYNYDGHSIYDIQVPGSKYHDADTSQYVFSGNGGYSSSWTWGNIVPPGLQTKVHDGTQTTDPTDPGYVYELGVSVALVMIPEPASLALLAIGATTLLMRRRRR